MSWKGKFPGGQLPEPIPQHSLLGTCCSAFVVFASCLWRPSRNDVYQCNTIWWSSPPISLCTVDYLSHFIQCVSRMSNQKMFVLSFCDALEVVPPRPFYFACLKWQHLKKKKQGKKWQHTRNHIHLHAAKQGLKIAAWLYIWILS